jgi:hypothetical protein
MTKEQIEAVLERVKTWPKERQEDAVQVLLTLEAQGTGLYRLSDDERKAVRRGLKEVREGKLAKDEDVEALFKRFGA